eukprot:4763775-Pleurochrysis_carterae.AAC.1
MQCEGVRSLGIDSTNLVQRRLVLHCPVLREGVSLLQCFQGRRFNVSFQRRKLLPRAYATLTHIL